MTRRAISSAVERLPYKQDVTGSNPVSRISNKACQALRATCSRSCSPGCGPCLGDGAGCGGVSLLVSAVGVAGVSATIAAWSGSTAPPTPAAVVALHTADQEGEDLDAALVRFFPEAQLEACESNQSSVKSASEAGSGVSWPVLVDIYRDHKLCSGDVKAATWSACIGLGWASCWIC